MNIYWVESLGSVNRWWEVVAPLLREAIDASAGEQTIDQVRDRLNSGEYRLLLGLVDEPLRDENVGAAWVAAPVHYPDFVALRIILGAGEPMEDWIAPLVENLEKSCNLMGFEQVEFFGRPGFQRALADWADHQYTVMVRKIPRVGRSHA